jgi:hypothetical protein
VVRVTAASHGRPWPSVPIDGAVEPCSGRSAPATQAGSRAVSICRPMRSCAGDGGCRSARARGAVFLTSSSIDLVARRAEIAAIDQPGDVERQHET